MTHIPSSTVVQLLYAVPPRLGLAGLVAQLRRGVPGGSAKGARVAETGRDTAHIDMRTGRLTLSLRRDVNRAIGACLTVAIGPRPDAPPSGLAPGPVAAEQTRLARKVTEAISARFAPNQTIWHITPAAVSAAMIDDLLATLPTELPRREATGDAVDMARVLAQIEQTLSGRDSEMPQQRRRTAGQGFATHWPAGKMSMGPAPANTPGAVPHATQQVAPQATLQAPANSLPALPRLDPGARLRAMATLTGTRPRTALMIRLGRSLHTMALSATA